MPLYLVAMVYIQHNLANMQESLYIVKNLNLCSSVKLIELSILKGRNVAIFILMLANIKLTLTTCQLTLAHQTLTELRAHLTLNVML